MLDSVLPKAAATVMVEPFREAATSSRTVEAKDLLNFSIQIASGMVREKKISIGVLLLCNIHKIKIKNPFWSLNFKQYVH